MIAILCVLAGLVWLHLFFLHGRFWRSSPEAPTAARRDGPPVAIVVPARDEAESIAAALRSLLAQDYAGALRVFLVDDGSTDGTGTIARALADPRLSVLDGARRPPGWSGKLWAVSQGVAAAEAWLAAAGNAATGKILLTDADIVHDSAHLSTLVAFARDTRRDMVSEMVALRCQSLAERALVPAFVFFFQLLYPFARVADERSRTAAAAGGVVLITARTLARIGGIAAIRGALIDDVALAGAVKASGARIWLGHARHARSMRPYPGLADVWGMVSRCAYVQLRRSPALLCACTGGMALVWLAPALLALTAPLAWERAVAAGALFLSLASYLPTLRRCGLSPLWSLLLPAIAVFYMAATIGSAVSHHRGQGLVWKGRAYGGDPA